MDEGKISITPTEQEGSDRRHLWHGLIFLATGLFMLGIYGVGDGPMPGGGESAAGDSLSFGLLAAIGMIAGSLFMFLGGKRFFAGNSVVVEYYEAIFMAVGIALLLRTFVIEPFKIPSGSMIPTLLVGDYLFVSKLAYGHRIPFSRERMFMKNGPKRGDVAVFEYPQDPRKDYIKRIVGLPGDRVTYHNKRLHLNGEPVGYEAMGQFSYKNEHGQEVESLRLAEKLPGPTGGEAVSHPILVRPFSYADITDTVVPPGHYFVMGDNRDNSNDSRAWGFVPAYRLVGEALVIFWSWDNQGGGLRWERLGQSVK
ncbi:MAG: signal peptidase I [Magnetococcus sp. YQC-3]